jgi:hypothetical protein
VHEIKISAAITAESTTGFIYCKLILFNKPHNKIYSR